MTRLYLLSALLPIVANALAIGATNETASAAKNETSVVDDAFIVECSSLSDVESLRQEIQSLGGTIRQNYTSDIFFGLSAQLPGESDGKASNFSAEMKTKSGVKNVWPIETVTLPEEETEEIEEAQENLQRHYSRRASDGKAPWNHLMTQVDKLHAEGYTGKGIKVGVVDTGVSLS